MFDDDLTIPDFLQRGPAEIKSAPVRRARQKKIPYPPDGFLGKGLRTAARERLRAARRRHAERCRQR